MYIKIYNRCAHLVHISWSTIVNREENENEEVDQEFLFKRKKMSNFTRFFQHYNCVALSLILSVALSFFSSTGCSSRAE